MHPSSEPRDRGAALHGRRGVIVDPQIAAPRTSIYPVSIACKPSNHWTIGPMVLPGRLERFTWVLRPATIAPGQEADAPVRTDRRLLVTALLAGEVELL